MGHALESSGSFSSMAPENQICSRHNSLEGGVVPSLLENLAGKEYSCFQE